MDLDVLYLIFYVIAAVCFLLGAFGATVHARVNLIALGLLFFVLVPLCTLIDTMGD